MAGAAFVIRSSTAGFIVVGGSNLVEQTVPLAKLYGAWVGIKYATRILNLDRLVIEGDSFMVISWIQKAIRNTPTLFLLRDIALMLRHCSGLSIHHVYREANSAADWAASFVAHHLGGFTIPLTRICLYSLDILYADSLGCTFFKNI